jgi:outer membrane protein assembly factor BamB
MRALALASKAGVVIAAIAALQTAATVPNIPLAYGAFTATFGADGAFVMSGVGWGTFKGTWKSIDGAIEIVTPEPAQCAGAGRYTPARAGTHLRLAVIEDACAPRRMILDRSDWRPATETLPRTERAVLRTAADPLPPLPAPAPDADAWPSFRGPNASGIAAKQNLPDQWDVKSGGNILWKIPIPGLAHSSPIVWGDRIFLTSAISSQPNATFKPGLYGDGDASDDRTPQRWVLYAIDRRTGRVIWERVATEGVPIGKRHIKSTYASATPATDGQVVVASFGSEGVFAFDVNGHFRWKLALGHLDVGAYDIPSYEWGPASSPIIWNGLVIVQCDTQQDSFLVAVDKATGQIVWRTPREELPSWGTPNVLDTSAGPELVTNASNYIRGYDPETGVERWRLGGSSKITAPTPILADGLILVSSGRAPERPIFAVKPGARGDLTLPRGQTSAGAVAWSYTARGPYMPTPIAYGGLLYVLGNNALFDAYEIGTGETVFRARAPHPGSGFSASPVAADGRIFLSSEDGDIVVVEAGREFKTVAVNHMNELLMATPAISHGAMFVRTVSSLVAIGRR